MARMKELSMDIGDALSVLRTMQELIVHTHNLLQRMPGYTDEFTPTIAEIELRLEDLVGRVAHALDTFPHDLDTIPYYSPDLCAFCLGTGFTEDGQTICTACDTHAINTLAGYPVVEEDAPPPEEPPAPIFDAETFVCPRCKGVFMHRAGVYVHGYGFICIGCDEETTA